MIQKLLQITIVTTTLCACMPYKVKTENFAEQREPSELKDKATSHWLYSVVPRHHSQIRWYDLPHWVTWSLFGNEDDGIFGEELSSGYTTQRSPGVMRALSWQLRNPLHNFFFYVIGSADRENSELALLKYGDNGLEAFEYKATGGEVFAGKSSGFLIALHGWKPFISLRLDYGRRFDTYIGWRERGNFGMKLNPAKKIKKKGSSEDDPIPPAQL